MAKRDAGIPDVAAVVESDPALTAAVLRAANAAATTGRRRFATTPDAIVRIGMLATRRIIAGTTLGQTFRDLGRSGLDLDETWRQLLRPRCSPTRPPGRTDRAPRRSRPASSTTSGVSRWPRARPSATSAVVRRVAAGKSVEEAEQSIFGFDHVDWGLEVARARDFPGAIVDGIAGHHLGEGSPVAWVVFDGRRVSSLLGIGDGVESRPEPRPLNESGAGFELVLSLGGARGIDQKIDWYRGIFQTRGQRAA